MSDINEQETPRGSQSAEGSSLLTAARDAAGSPATGSPGNEGGTEFHASFSRLLEWADKKGLIRPESEFPFFQRPPDGYGEEHQAWYDEPSNRWFKATYPNRFGLAWGRDGSATAGEYLSRLCWQNEFFGDDVELVALINCGGKLRVLTSQSHIKGEPAPYSAIQQWFEEIGYTRLEIGSRIAWYREAENLLVADAHEGNVLQVEGGELVPIDLKPRRGPSC